MSLSLPSRWIREESSWNEWRHKDSDGYKKLWAFNTKYIFYLGQVIAGYSSKYPLSISHLSQLLIHFFRKRSEFLRRIFQHRVINLKNGKFTLSVIITPRNRVVCRHRVKSLSGAGGFVLDQGIRGYQNINNIHRDAVEIIPLPLYPAKWCGMA